MADLTKKDSPAWLLFPSPNFLLDKDPDMSKMPKLVKDPETNQLLWNLGGTALTTAAVTALVTIAANKIAKNRWENKRKKVHDTKINALFPISTPNKNPDEKVIKELRAIGLVDDNTASKPIEKSASTWAYTALPLLATIPISMFVRNRINDELKDERENELDEEIYKKRKKLQSLYAEVLKKIKDGDSNLYKNSSAACLHKEAEMTWSERLGVGITMTPITLALLSGLASYYFTKKHDDAEVKTKVLEKQILPQNLTNIPDTLEVITGEDESIPETRKQQKYIDQLNKAVEDLG